MLFLFIYLFLGCSYERELMTAQRGVIKAGLSFLRKRSVSLSQDGVSLHHTRKRQTVFHHVTEFMISSDTHPQLCRNLTNMAP